MTDVMTAMTHLKLLKFHRADDVLDFTENRENANCSKMTFFSPLCLEFDR